MMRWVPLAILIYLVVLAQTTIGSMLRLDVLAGIGPDLAALAVVFLALHGRSVADVMLAAWAFGLAVDLTSAAGAGAVTAVGPMSIAYALAAGMIFQLRDSFFRERSVTQILMAMLFCVVAHGLWITMQSLIAYDAAGWANYGRLWKHALGISAYSALLMPPATAGLRRIQRLFIASPTGRRRR